MQTEPLEPAKAMQLKHEMNVHMQHHRDKDLSTWCHQIKYVQIKELGTENL